MKLSSHTLRGLKLLLCHSWLSTPLSAKGKIINQTGKVSENIFNFCKICTPPTHTLIVLSQPVPSYRVFCLLGDGEMSEGAVWEAMSFASYYQLDNLVAIMDINRLGQCDAAPLQHHVEKYQKRCEAFGYVEAGGNKRSIIICLFIAITCITLPWYAFCFPPISSILYQAYQM